MRLTAGERFCSNSIWQNFILFQCGFLFLLKTCFLELSGSLLQNELLSVNWPFISAIETVIYGLFTSRTLLKNHLGVFKTAHSSPLASCGYISIKHFIRSYSSFHPLSETRAEHSDLLWLVNRLENLRTMCWSPSNYKRECYIVMPLCYWSKQRSQKELFQARGRETPSGGDTAILAFADHLDQGYSTKIQRGPVRENVPMQRSGTSKSLTCFMN